MISDRRSGGSLPPSAAEPPRLFPRRHATTAIAFDAPPFFALIFLRETISPFERRIAAVIAFHFRRDFA